MRRIFEQAFADGCGAAARLPASWKTLVLILFIVLQATRLPSSAAQVEDGQAQSDASYTFGQNMRFTLRAKSTEVIEDVTLFFNTPDMEQTYAVDVELSPAREINLSHEVSLTQVRLAPFTTVRYWWRLATRNGSLMVGEKTITYSDDRFSWQLLENDGIQVRWTGEETDMGQMALDIVANTQAELASIFPGALAPLRIYIYPSMADLRSALRLTGRDWLGAEAMPELGVVLVTAVNPRTAALDLGKSIPHELSHLMLYRTLETEYGDAPRWLDEGLATRFELTPDANDRALLDDAVANKTTIPMAALCATFPGDDAGAGLAYAQSASFVQFIRQEHGTAALRALVQAYADGASCESGVQRALNVSLTELEANWLRSVAPVSPVVAFLRMNGLWMALAGAGFLFMLVLLLPSRRVGERSLVGKEI